MRANCLYPLIRFLYYYVERRDHKNCTHNKTVDVFVDVDDNDNNNNIVVYLLI